MPTHRWEHHENIPKINGSLEVTDVSVALRELSEPRASGEPVKAAIARAAKRSGLSYWRAFDIWYGKARRIEPNEATQVETALVEKNRVETRNEVRDLRKRLEILESRLAQVDEDFHRETLAALGAQVRGLG
jgi:hypothetical protein